MYLYTTILGKLLMRICLFELDSMTACISASNKDRHTALIGEDL